MNHLSEAIFKNKNTHSIPMRRGFTLIELLVVLSILSLLLTIATPKYFQGIERAKEATLKQDLFKMRESIDQYYADQGSYPDTLEDLVEKKYIRQIPVDPITESNASWITDPPPFPLNGQIYDIHSGATGTSRNGSFYNEW